MVTLVMLITFGAVCFMFYVMGVDEGVRRTEEKIAAERRMFFGMQVTVIPEEDADEHKTH